MWDEAVGHALAVVKPKTAVSFEIDAIVASLSVHEHGHQITDIDIREH